MTALATRKQMEFTDHNGVSIAPPETFNPMALVQSAIEKGVDAATLERLTAVGERWLETQAKQEFAHALAGFQREMKPVHKGRKADRFSYAGFDDIMAQASPILSRFGISIGFDSKHDDKCLAVTCRIRVGSYHEDRTFTVPVPASLKVSEPQQYGAALSYAKRYALCAALNIVVTDEDNEAALNTPITSEQMAELNALIEAKGVILSNFLGAYQVDSMSELTQAQYKKALPVLIKRKATK